MKKILNKIKFKNVLVLFVIVYLSVSLISTQVNLAKKRQELEGLMQIENELILEIEQTQIILEQEDIGIYLENIARDRLGFASEKERVFIDVQKEK